MIEYCVCGHEKERHIFFPQFAPTYCKDCFLVGGTFNQTHKFKLDNLSYIEDLAREKGLI